MEEGEDYGSPAYDKDKVAGDELTERFEKLVQRVNG